MAREPERKYIMNKVIIMGRLTRDPDVRYSQGDDPKCVSRYTVAVDRRQRGNNGDQTADFISVVAFGKSGEFAEKYLKKGTKVLITGRIQTGSYTKDDGTKVYTTDVVAEDQEFAESKNTGASNNSAASDSSAPTSNPTADSAGDGFMNIPDGIDEELPFN